MRKSTGLLAAALLLAATPALAGNLDFENGDAVWRSSRCERPVAPKPDMKITPEIRGNDLNALIAQRNAYTEKVQAYMDCVGNEAENDQMVIGQAISTGAQKEIDEARAEVDKVFGAPRTTSAQ
ncbi:MAG: hypothetical protein PHE27_07165 [Alphaproteobacteria bacterium]|nr:hypothetical protein [Alphaproteobacteria bacterium]